MNADPDEEEGSKDMAEVDDEMIDREDELASMEVVEMDVPVEAFPSVSPFAMTSKYSAIELYRAYLEDLLGFDSLMAVYSVVKDLEQTEGMNYDSVYEQLSDVIPADCKHYIQWVHSLVFLENRADQMH